jgi:hypothetical protein
MRPEIDKLPLVDTKARVKIRLRHQGDRDIGTDTAIAENDVVLRPFRVQLSRMGHVVRPQRRDDHVVQEARLRVEKGQDVRDRETAAGFLPAGLAEVGLEFGRIGHGEPGTVDQCDTMTMPPRDTAGSFDPAGGRLDQPPDNLHRKTLSSLTIRRGAESLAREVRQVRHGGLPMNHLENEQVQGR